MRASRAAERTRTLDTIKSIAVPVTRKRSGGKSKAASLPLPVIDSEAVGRMGGQRRQPVASRSHAPEHKYRVGQRVTLRGGGRLWARVENACKVVALLPYEGSALRYRIRSEAENFERVVDEIDLFIPSPD